MDIHITYRKTMQINRHIIAANVLNDTKIVQLVKVYSNGLEEDIIKH